MAAALPMPAFAQTGLAPSENTTVTVLPGLINLDDSTKSIKIGPRVYTTKDTTGRVSYTAIIEGYLGNNRGTIKNRNIMTLGYDGAPHWVVFSLKNTGTRNKSWVLSLGSHMDGRYGAFEKLFIYNHISQQYLLYAMPDQNGKMPPASSMPVNGYGIPFTLDPGKQALVVMYIVPEGGAPVTLSPEIMTAGTFWETQRNMKNSVFFMNAAFLVSIGFFVALLLLKQNFIGITFILYIGAQLAILNTQNNIEISDFLLGSETSPLLLGVVAVLGLVLTRQFFSNMILENRDRILIDGLILACIIFSAIAVLIFPEKIFLRPLVVLGVPNIAFAMLFLLTVSQTLSGKPGALPMASGWLLLASGSILGFLSLQGTIPALPTLINGYWIAALLQIPLLALSAVRHSKVLQQTAEEEATIAAESSKNASRAKVAKDSSENSRLLRVIEHERGMLQELRDRELQQNEEMRKAKENADNANRAKSAFLAVISHEIRTPMTGIMGMVRLLMETTLSREQRDYTKTIQDSGEAMLALLNDILDFEKIESGKMDLEVIDFDLHRLVNDIITLMSGHANQKNISLKAEIDPSIPKYIRGDPVRLRQVLLNLTGNAIKFTSYGGVTLTIKPSYDEGTQKSGWHRLYFGVRDTGIGISKDAQRNLFNPFSQADTSISRKYGGSGLGLAICQRLIEAMGGKIMIESIENEGSTFFFTISAEEGSEDQIAESSSSGPMRLQSHNKPEKALRILCVDDNEINQKLLKEFVTRIGHTAVVATTGEQAIEMVKSDHFDMVLMDIELPGISGMGATKAIRALPDQTKAIIPVIALTGNVRDEDIRQCYAANMNGHLAKPIEPEKLKLQTEKVIHNQLDNPVKLQEPDQIPQIIQEVKIKDPDSGTKKEKDVTLNDEYALAEDSETENDRAPIFAYANQDTLENQNNTERKNDMNIDTDIDLDLTDEDLDEDSFTSAIKQHEASEIVPQAIFDPSSLDPLKQSMKHEDLKEMIDSVVTKTDEILVALESAIENADHTTIAARAHELKGMTGNFGLGEISQIAAKMEKTAKDKTLDGLDELYSALPEASIRAKEALENWMNS